MLLSKLSCQFWGMVTNQAKSQNIRIQGAPLAP